MALQGDPGSVDSISNGHPKAYIDCYTKVVGFLVKKIPHTESSLMCFLKEDITAHSFSSYCILFAVPNSAHSQCARTVK